MQKKLISLFQILKKAYGPQHWWPAESPLEVVVGAILTQNTSWANVERAIGRLKKKNLLSIRRLSHVPLAVLSECLKPSGYFNVKTRRLKNFLDFLAAEYGGSLSRLFVEPLASLRQKLLGVNGIGPETADSILLYAAGKPVFVVDAYTRRIFSRMGLIRHDVTYQEIQSYFMKSLPNHAALFNEFHALIVEHAKTVCRKNPLCEHCKIKQLCDYGSGKELPMSSPKVFIGDRTIPAKRLRE